MRQTNKQNFSVNKWQISNHTKQERKKKKKKATHEFITRLSRPKGFFSVQQVAHSQPISWPVFRSLAPTDSPDFRHLRTSSPMRPLPGSHFSLAWVPRVWKGEETRVWGELKGEGLWGVVTTPFGGTCGLRTWPCVPSANSDSSANLCNSGPLAKTIKSPQAAQPRESRETRHLAVAGDVPGRWEQTLYSA